RPGICRPGTFSPSPISRHTPPTLASRSHNTVFMPAGPNHWPNCSGSVQAANTRSGVASNVRVMRRMRPLADSAMTFPLLCGLRLRRSSALQERIQSVERLLPEAAVELDPVGGGAKSLAAQLAAPPLRFGVAFDQAGIGQHAQMPRHCRQRHIERLG